MRDFEVATYRPNEGEEVINVERLVEQEEVGPAWLDVIRKRPVKEMTFCWFDGAEEVIAFIAFQDGSFDVRVEESMRPTDQLCMGRIQREAEDKFWNAITQHARFM